MEKSDIWIKHLGAAVLQLEKARQAIGGSNQPALQHNHLHEPIATANAYKYSSQLLQLLCNV